MGPSHSLQSSQSLQLWLLSTPTLAALPQQNIYEAYLAAYNADPVSIFGGIVALNRPVDAATAEELSKIFLEIVIAPEFSPEAMAILTKKKNLRLLALPALAGNEKQDFSIYSSDLKKVAGGLLLQEQDTIDLVEDKLQVVTKKAPTDAEWEELRFAWKVVKHVKSNAIVLAKDLATVGVGAGQMNRIDAARIAIAAAGEKAEGSVLASDAFFPFPDVVEEASRAGISAIIQPGAPSGMKSPSSLQTSAALPWSLQESAISSIRR